MNIKWNSSEIRKKLGGLPIQTKDGFSVPSTWIFTSKVAGLHYGQLMFLSDSFLNGENLVREVPRATLWRWKNQFRELGLID